MTDAPLHILVLADRDWTHPQGGGSGRNLREQVRRWLAWGHRVSVIACGYPGSTAFEREGALTIHRLGGRATVFPQTIARQARGLVPDADVTLEIVNGICFLTPLWLRTPRLTLVHHIHAGRQYREEMGRAGAPTGWALETLPLRTIYRRSRFVTVSRSTQQELVDHGIPRAAISLSHNGVDLEAFAPGERAPTPTLLFLGRLKRYKRIELILDALEQLPGVRLEIAGDGDHRPALEAGIDERGLRDRVTVHGHVDDAGKRLLLQRAWCNVTASTAEGWCLTVMEAAACATPSAALAVGGLREAIVHERTGLLARDAEELTERLRRITAEPALRDRLGSAALARAREFTWDRTAQTTMNLLRGVAAQGGAASGSLPGTAVPAGRELAGSGR